VPYAPGQDACYGGAEGARFARDHGLPFAESLSEASILAALDEHGVKFRDRIFSPVTTIWGFLSQVLSEDHSCRDAVSRVLAHRAASGLEPCSPNTASYCDSISLYGPIMAPGASRDDSGSAPS
jgi:hypothetical protein